jgi:hypothetical protein
MEKPWYKKDSVQAAIVAGILGIIAALVTGLFTVGTKDPPPPTPPPSEAGSVALPRDSPDSGIESEESDKSGVPDKSDEPDEPDGPDESSTSEKTPPVCELTVAQPECNLGATSISLVATFFEEPFPRAKIEFFGTTSGNEAITIRAGGSGSVQVVTSDGDRRALNLRSQRNSKRVTVNMRSPN